MAASGRRVAELEYDLLCLLRPPGASDAARRDGGTPRGIH
jgi:hypothetical protein